MPEPRNVAPCPHLSISRVIQNGATPNFEYHGWICDDCDRAVFVSDHLERAPERRLTREQVRTIIRRGCVVRDVAEEITDEIMRLIEGKQ